MRPLPFGRSIVELRAETVDAKSEIGAGGYAIARTPASLGIDNFARDAARDRI